MKNEIEEAKLSDFQPQTDNANLHTLRGMRMLAASLENLGYVAPMTAAAHGEVLDGSARLELAFAQFDDEVLVIKHDGSKPIIMIRTDIEDATSQKAKEISYKANRVAEIDLDWSPEQLLLDLESGIDLSDAFYPEELNEILSRLVDYEEVAKDHISYTTCPHCGKRFPQK